MKTLMRRYVPLLLAALLTHGCAEDEGTGFVVHVEPASEEQGSVPQLTLKVLVGGRVTLEQRYSNRNDNIGIKPDGRYASFGINVKANPGAQRRIWVRSEMGGTFEGEAVSVEQGLNDGERREITLKLSPRPLPDANGDKIPDILQCPNVVNNACVAAPPPTDAGSDDAAVDAM